MKPQTINIPESNQQTWRDSFRQHQNMLGPCGLHYGDTYHYTDEIWFIHNFNAVANAPRGITLDLVSVDFKVAVLGVEIGAGEPWYAF